MDRGSSERKVGMSARYTRSDYFGHNPHIKILKILFGWSCGGKNDKGSFPRSQVVG